VLALRERLLNTAGIAERFAIVERWLIARLSPRHAVHPAVRWAVDRIAESVGRVSVSDLATQTGYTRKHLATLFERQVGMTPKALCRVHRPLPPVSLGLGAGFSAGLCWVTASFGISYLFERRSLKLFLINGGYHTLQFTIIGLLLALWH
jgi:AraC-like DNA-binding protein